MFLIIFFTNLLLFMIFWDTPAGIGPSLRHTDRWQMDRQTSKLKESFRYKFHTFLVNIYLLGFLHEDLWLTRNKILILYWNLYQKLHSVNEFEFLIYINPKSKTVTYILKYHRFTTFILHPCSQNLGKSCIVALI